MVNNARLIRNPASRGAPPLERLKSAVGGIEGWEISINETTSAGHATELALIAAAQNADAVIACGGDGTVNEVANGLAGSGTPLAVIRGGTANVWAKEAGVPRRPTEALQLLVTGDRRSIDLGRVRALPAQHLESGDPPRSLAGENDDSGERYFLLMAGIGFDASIVSQASGALKRRLGATAYLWQGVRNVFNHRAEVVDLVIDGVAERASLYWLLLGNTRSYAGVANLTHLASAVDGKLDFCLLERGGLRRIAWLAPWVLLGRHAGRANVRYRTVESLEVRTPGLPVQIDGDYLTETPISIDIVRHALRVIVPAELDSPLFRRPNAE